MSRIFDALRQIEQEVQASRKHLQKVREMPLPAIQPETQPASEEVARRYDEAQQALDGLESRLRQLEARVSATRDELAALLDGAERLQQSWRTEVENTQRKIQGLRREVLQASSETATAQLESEMAVFCAGVVERARRRLEDKTALAIEELAKSAEAWLAALTKEFQKEIAAQANPASAARRLTSRRTA